MSETKENEDISSYGEDSSSEEASSEPDSREIDDTIEDLGKPGNSKKLKRGMTHQLGAENRKEIEIDNDPDSSDQEEKDKRIKNKAKMRKIKNKTKKNKEENKEGIQTQGKSKPKEKLAKVAKNIKQLMARKVTEVDGKNSSQANKNQAASSNLKKEKKKNSNANFLSKLEESENNHGELTYGSYIVLNIENEGEEHRKFTTKFRTTNKVQGAKMDRENYDANCVFRIIPSSQFTLLSKLLAVVEDENIPPNFELDYENFMSEMEDNVDAQDDLMGKPIKYGSKFQLVQESSKRFL